MDKVFFSEFDQGLGAVYSLAASHRLDDKNGASSLDQDIGEEIPAGAFKIKSWGKQNDLPTRREEALAASNIVATLIGTKRDITLGAGVYVYEEYFENGEKKKREIQPGREVLDFLERLEENGYFEEAAGEFFKHGNGFVLGTPTKGGGIYDFEVLSCKNVRAVIGKKGRKIAQFATGPDWAGVTKGIDLGKAEFSQVKRLPAWMPTTSDPKPPKGSTFIYHIADKLLRPDGYYYFPAYWGGKTWIELANAIPVFHRANLLNSYSIKYHIEIPEGYLQAAPGAEDRVHSKEEIEALEREAREAFIDDMNKFLAGIHNAGRAFYSSYEINKLAGKDFPGVKITPLKVDLQDKALLDLFEKSNQANISAQAIHPTLAAIETQGKLSSGSEMRNALEAYIKLKAPHARREILKPLKWAARVNGWGDIHFGFKDIKLEKLDDDKAGVAEVINNE